MSDPAVEAAQRAWSANEALDGIHYEPGDGGLWTPDAMEAAAREMAKPIRDWFHSQQEKWVYGQGGISPTQLAELAPLIFNSEELER